MQPVKNGLASALSAVGKLSMITDSSSLEDAKHLRIDAEYGRVSAGARGRFTRRRSAQAATRPSHALLLAGRMRSHQSTHGTERGTAHPGRPPAAPAGVIISQFVEGPFRARIRWRIIS